MPSICFPVKQKKNENKQKILLNIERNKSGLT